MGAEFRLTRDQIAGFNTNAAGLVRPRIVGFSADDVAASTALSSTAVQALSGTQVAAITPVQLTASRATQLAAYLKNQLIEMTPNATRGVIRPK